MHPIIIGFMSIISLYFLQPFCLLLLKVISLRESYVTPSADITPTIPCKNILFVIRNKLLIWILRYVQ